MVNNPKLVEKRSEESRGNPAALLFGLQGLMADDTEAQVNSWLHVINDYLGSTHSSAQIKMHLDGDGDEVLQRVFGYKYFSAFELKHLTDLKEKHYREHYTPVFLPGLVTFLRAAFVNDIPAALVTSASPEHIAYVLGELDLRDNFEQVYPDFATAAGALAVPLEDCLILDRPKNYEKFTI